MFRHLSLTPCQLNGVPDLSDRLQYPPVKSVLFAWSSQSTEAALTAIFNQPVTTVTTTFKLTSTSEVTMEDTWRIQDRSNDKALMA